jgi:hypothetical protein
MDMTKKIQHLEDELKLLKNEVHNTLLDIKDSLASGYQPSNAAAQAGPAPQSAPSAPAPAPVSAPASPPGASSWVGPSSQPVPPPVQHSPAPSEPVRFQYRPQEAKVEEPTPSAEQQEPEIVSRQEPAPGPAPRPEPAARPTAEPEQTRVVTEEKGSVPSFVEYRIPVQENGSSKVESNDVGSNGDRTDLATLATLGDWADRSARRVGRERVEAILEVYQATGYLALNLKTVLLKLLALDNAPVSEAPVSLRDCITVLLELNGIVIGHSKTEAAMLSLLVSGR